MWDPQTYLAFDAERTRPARDLLAAVKLDAPARVVDLGCGPGNSTRLLAKRWPSAEILGIDLSAKMIAAARADAPPNVRYDVDDAASWRPDPDVNLVFSNALLQWLPRHLDLLAGWLAGLRTGAVLAMQVPVNFDQPTHTLLREICAGVAWRERLGHLAERHENILPARSYLDRLIEPGRRLDVWETTYLHRLEGADPILRWMRGTGLRPALDALVTEEQRAALLTEYGAALRRVYLPDRDGRTTLPFRRLFLVATVGMPERSSRPVPG